MKNFMKQFVYAVIPTKYKELTKFSIKGLIGYVFAIAGLESFLLVVGSLIGTAMEVDYQTTFKEWVVLMIMYLGFAFVYCIVRPILHVILAAVEGFLPGLLVSWIGKRKCSASDLFKASLYAGTLTAYMNCILFVIPLDIDIPFWIMTIIDIAMMVAAVLCFPKKNAAVSSEEVNSADNAEPEVIDGQAPETASETEVTDVKEPEGASETEAPEAAPKVKEPNFFQQLWYSLLPFKYGKLADVGVKKFIFFIIWESVIGGTAAWIGMMYNEIVSKGYLDDISEWFIIIGLSVPICLFMTIILAVVNAVVSFLKGMPIAVLISWLSKKKCSFFDMYKATIYSQTMVYIASVCCLVIPRNLTWFMILAWVISFFILLFGIFYLPRKPFFPGMDE